MIRYAPFAVACALLLDACASTGSLPRGRGVLGVSAGKWRESDVPPRLLVRFALRPSAKLEEAWTVVGEPQAYTVAAGDTLFDVARYLGLGIGEVETALPGVDPWVPPTGTTLEIPTWWVLPEGDYHGIVVNIPEMRLYYFPEEDGQQPTVVTYAVGLGRDDWRTPTGRFRITSKDLDPKWVIPETIRRERIRDQGRHEREIAGGDPENPLGRHRMRLSLPMYSIHGTNTPWGVGRQTSHGCIRLYPEDIAQLFALVPPGTPGVFVYQPVKVGARDGLVYVEVHPSIYQERFDYRRAVRSLLRRRGWERFVDWKKVAAAIERRSGIPTAVSAAAGAVRTAGSPGA